MSTDVILPQLGLTMADGTLVEWLVAEGDTVDVGTLIFALETDKSVQEIESPAAGVIRDLKPTGEIYDVGAILAVID